MMNTNRNIDLDALRSAWREFNVAPPREVVMNGRKAMQTHRTSLMRQHRVSSLVCAVWAVLSVPLLCLNSDVQLPVWAGMYLSMYFAVMGVISMLEYYSYKDIDVYCMSVRDCMKAVLHAKKLRRRGKIAGMTMAIPALGYMLWFFHGVSMAMFVGAWAGLVTGAFIGVMIDMRVRRHLRQMTEFLESLESEGVADGEVEGE